MRDRLNTYTAYSIGCAVVWAVLLTAVAAVATTAKLHVFLLLFAGWVIGWISATCPLISVRAGLLPQLRLTQSCHRPSLI